MRFYRGGFWGLIFIFLVTGFGCSEPASEQSENSNSAESSGEVNTLTAENEFTYQLLNERVSDTPIKTEVEQNIVVTGIPTKESLRTEILRRYKEISSRTGFQYYEHPTNIFIYVYATEEQARAGQGLWIAMLAKGFNETGIPDVIISESRLAALSTPSEEKFGFSEEVRKKIFKEIADAEDRAMREAMARIPDTRIMEQIDLQRELETKYKSEIQEKYGLNKDQLLEIAIEGVQKGWPF